MSMFVNRDGSISIVRVGTFVAVLGVLFGIVGFILFTLDQQRFGSPLEVDLYPGSEAWGAAEEFGPAATRSVYRVSGVDAELVAQFYREQMYDYYDTSAAEADTDEDCQRFPVAGVSEFYVEGNGNVPFEYVCFFNDSQYGSNRSTEITIQPGVRNDETGTDTVGSTVVVYEQFWQP